MAALIGLLALLFGSFFGMFDIATLPVRAIIAQGLYNLLSPFLP